MVEQRKREPERTKHLFGSEERFSEAPRRYAADNQGHSSSSRERKMGPENEAHPTISLRITPRRVYIDPEERRNQYILRLEALGTQLDGILNNPRVPRKYKLRAMDVLIKTIKTCYNIVREIEVEQLEQELKTLKTKDQRTEASYSIEEDPTL